jgi:hypothetical protein
MTLIEPFLLITLHFSQIGFTDDLTFTVIRPFQKSTLVEKLAFAITQDKCATSIISPLKTNSKQFFTEVYLSRQMILPLVKS